MRIDQANEQSIRRRAKRLGYGVHKTRTRNTHINDQGKYMLFDAYRNLVILGAHFDATIDDISAWLALREERQ